MDEDELTLDIEVVPDTTIVRCRGALTLASAIRLRNEVERLLPQARVVTIDFTDLIRIDSAGLGAIVSLHASAQKAGREVRIANIGKRTREIFSVTRVL